MFGNGGMAAFICLNPSTADETNDDPTVRRCIRYAKAWGMSGMFMLNIFAYRATDPKEMMTQDDPVGPYNDMYIKNRTSISTIVIAAWGTHGVYKNRETEIMKMLPDLKCLKVTKDGHPAHPLYLKKDLEPISFNGGRKDD